MKGNIDEQDLHTRFDELREEVTASVPPFEVNRVTTTRRLPRSWILAPAGTAALVAALLWAADLRDGRPPAPGMDLSVFAWTAPTDFLLETPGSHLLRSVPVPDLDAYAPTSVGPGRGAADSSS